jgi:hypothetical protein
MILSSTGKVVFISNPAMVPEHSKLAMFEIDIGFLPIKFLSPKALVWM